LILGGLLSDEAKRKRLTLTGLVKSFTCLLFALLATAATAGCGDDGSSISRDATNDVAAALERPERCLARLGALRAGEPADVNFFVEDFEDGDTNSSASAGNGIAEVSEHDPVTIAGPPGTGPPLPRYLVWIGQPMGDDLHPEAALEEQGSETFVMFVRHPDRRQVRAAMRCLNEFGTDLPRVLSG
jgi:hypothetical protein